MSESIFSAYWYRVAGLRPQLRAHARARRHLYRGEVWHVIGDGSSGRHHRLSPAAWALVGAMDGQRSVQELWDAVTTRLGDDAPTQDETIRLLGQLHAADLLRCDVPPDGQELFQRFERDQQNRRLRRFGNPLSLRIPLLDPDRWLERGLPLVRPLCGRLGALVWLVVVTWAGALGVANVAELTQDLVDRVFSAQNLLLFALVFPVVKILHEAGHAFATKLGGGEVHEAGVMLLAFMPVPYVDASAASAFPERGRRMAVGAAGILVEVFLAALALFVWRAVEPGTLRALAWNVMLIGGVSTLLFNGNPLLRYDGYYVLADAIDVPNLAGRASRYLAYLLQRHLLGVAELRSPANAPGERPWLLGYGVAAFLYRLFIVFAIALFVAERFQAVGVAIALLGIFAQVALPLARGGLFLLADRRLGGRRPRALAASALLVLGLAALLCVLPLPLRTRAEGVVWLPEGSQVRARADGFVRRVLVEPESRVRSGDPLLESEDPLLEAQVALLEARLAELRARRGAAWGTERVASGILDEEIAAAEAELAHARERAAETLLRSPADGRFVLPQAQHLPARFLRQGELVGYVMDAAPAKLRVAVPQADVALVRSRTRAVRVRLAERPGQVLAARIEREVPSASAKLPSPALGRPAGGPFAVDPSDREGVTALETVFQFELVLQGDVPLERPGERVHVRFDHGSEPLVQRAARALRRLLLGRLGV